MKEFHTYTLPNGIRGIHRQVRGNVAHCALVVGAGTRDELKSEYGLAHFAEHAFFKGTQRRRAYQVNCRLENLGGELNAYTTKEDTTLHATVLRGRVELGKYPMKPKPAALDAHDAGADAITWTPPSAQQLQSQMMAKYRGEV